MATQKTTWLFTVKHPSGVPLFSLMVESELVPEPEPPANPQPPARPEERPKLPPHGGDNEPRMTDPQKRYLFRLLAQQGIEGKQAEDHLKEYFKVKALRDVTKASASQLIEQMVADRREVRDGAA